MVLLLPLLPTQALWRRRRTEVRRTIASTRTGRWTAQSTGPRSAKSAPRARSAETASSWARSAEAAAWRPRTWRPVLAGSCLAHGKVPALKRLRVELLNDLIGDFAIRELNEREPTRPASLTIDRHNDMRRFRDGGEVGAKVGF